MNDFLIYPELTIQNKIIIACCVSSSVVMFFKEIFKTGNQKMISKNNNGYYVDGNIGMVIAYSIPIWITLVITIYKWITMNEAKYIGYFMPNIMIILHFIKRMYESYYVHIYSQKQLNKIILVSILYSLTLTLTIYYQFIIGNPMNYKNSTQRISFYMGIFLYIIGEYGNYYHHYLLKQLRINNKSNNKYFIPDGCLFKYCILSSLFM